jgi:type VI secretion system protein ImpG
MQDLLPHFERELGFLRTHAKEFAARYPRIAGRLATTGEVLEDPHVERLVQSFALLSSRIHKRLDDDFPLITESLLEVLYPHYLRPFPACSVAVFDLGGNAGQLTQGVRVPRGTLLQSRAVRGVTCRMRTVYDVQLLPMKLTQARFRGVVGAPDGTAVPREATSVFSVQLELAGAQSNWEDLGLQSLRVHLDGEASHISALREALCSRVVGAFVQLAPVGPWSVAPQCQPMAVGFADDESLLDFDARSHQAYRLLTEYFAFPDKFNFIDLPLPRALLASNARSITLHYVLAGIRSDSDEARLLETIVAKNLLLGATPVVNLFNQRADPIRITHATSAYPVLPDARRAFGYEVHAINRVYRVQESSEGETIHAFKPFYSLSHDELLRDGETAGRYWYAHRDAGIADRSPGYETEIAIVDVNFDPAHPQTDTLSIDVTATNRDLPSQLSVGLDGGDLFLEGGSMAREIRLLRRPTHTHRIDRGRGALWRLVSHLSLNHLTLSGGGIDALKETLRLYDLPRSATNRRLLDGVLAIDFKPATAWLPGNPFATFVRGTEVRLTVDEQSFVGSGLHLFAQVMDHFFGLYVHANSFAQLKVLSSRTGETLVACARRSGDSPLM